MELLHITANGQSTSTTNNRRSSSSSLLNDVSINSRERVIITKDKEQVNENGLKHDINKETDEKMKAHVERTTYTLEEVSYHCDPSSCWIIMWDQVYDVTQFVREHPGGEDIIYEHGGRDATWAFRDVGHSSDAHLMMMPYRIGILVEHERIFKRKKSESVCI